MTPRSFTVATDNAGGGPEDGEGFRLQPYSPRTKNDTGKIRDRILEGVLCRPMFPLRTSRNLRKRIEGLIELLPLDQAVVSIASCSLFSEYTIADLVVRTL
jgi:hypothetical protein